MLRPNSQRQIVKSPSLNDINDAIAKGNESGMPPHLRLTLHGIGEQVSLLVTKVLHQEGRSFNLQGLMPAGNDLLGVHVTLHIDPFTGDGAGGQVEVGARLR